MSSPRFSLIAGLLLQAPTVLRAELPPEAQAAMDKGVLAAQQEDFLLAAKFFSEARETAPEAPELLYNLGLAESKIAGRELRAIAWFGAYLAANPVATNAVAVKKQMNALDVTSQVNLSRFIKTVADAASLVPNPDRQKTYLDSVSLDQGGALHNAALLLARNGNSAEALKVAEGITEPKYRSRAQGGIGLVLAAAGDRAGAQKCFSLAVRTGKNTEAIMDLAQNQAKAGEFEAALMTAGNAPPGNWKNCFWKCEIAKAMIEHGGIPAAKRLLAETEQAASYLNDDPIDYLPPKSFTYNQLAGTYVQAGDLAAARRAADQMNAKCKTVLFNGADEKKSLLANIANAEAAKQEKASRSPEETGDRAGAPPAADQLDNGKTRPEKPSPNSAQDWIALNTGKLNEPIFTEYGSTLATLPKGSALETFNALHNTASAMLNARELVTRMLKLQARPRTKS